MEHTTILVQSDGLVRSGGILYHSSRYIYICKTRLTSNDSSLSKGKSTFFYSFHIYYTHTILFIKKYVHTFCNSKVTPSMMTHQ